MFVVLAGISVALQAYASKQPDDQADNQAQ